VKQSSLVRHPRQRSDDDLPHVEYHRPPTVVLPRLYHYGNAAHRQTEIHHPAPKIK
jgi:hypothetical protein